MEWTSIKIKNFLSIVDAELKLDNRGLVLIEGRNLASNKFKSNGAGKTSIIESIVYALFDTTSKGMKANEVVNNKVGKNTSVILEGHQDGHVYRIERYRKHSKNKNKVRLFCDGTEITGKSTADTNKMIENLIGIDYKTFINSIMFSQSSGAGRFAIATDKEKKEILEGVVNLAIYADAQAVAKERIKVKDNEIQAKKREIERSNWELAQVDQLEQQDQQNYENTLKVIKQQRDVIGSLTDEMEAYVRKHLPTVLQLEDEIKALTEQSRNMVTVSLDSYIEAVQRAKEELTEYTSEFKRLNTDKTKLVNDYKKIQMATHCPVCGHELDPVHREQEMESIKAQLKEVLIQIQVITHKQQQAQTTYEQATEEYQKFKKAADEATEAYQKVLADIQAKEKWIADYNRNLQNYKDRIKNAQDTLNSLSGLPQPKKRDKERESIREKIKVQKQEQLALERERQSLETVVKVYSNAGVKSHVLDLITPFLNKRGNEYLSILSGPEMELIFSTQTKNKDGSVSDKFDLQVINHAGGDDYKSQSEGEKKRADLSIALALQDFVASKTKINFALYDEVFDALDEVGSENVVTLLRERQKTVGTIFVITHSEHLKPLFEKVITITKDKNGQSTITEGVATS